jgi:hypothetical protein
MYIANFPNSGYIGHEFTEQELFPIKEEINSIQNSFNTAEKVDHTFTSTVKKEYKIVSSLSYLEKLLVPIIQVYYEYFNIDRSNKELYLHNAWVNFQEKEEFFSPHTHIGEFSFALYIKVPFLIQDEQTYLSTTEKTIKTASGFVFYYTDTLGNITPNYLPIDKTWENKIIFFPGRFLHSVQPFFTSNDYRITVSGNIRYKND